MLRRTRRSLSASLSASLSVSLCAFVLAGAVHAAELGEPRVSSHIGQQLVADIELTMIEDPGATVGVRLASPEVYREAGIAVPPVLSTLNLSVMRRDGRQFLHATTLRPVDGDHLHLYLELVDHGQRVVRLATLWLTPDPEPAPAPASIPASAPAAVPAPAPAAVPAPASPPAHARVAAGPTPPASASIPASVSAPARAPVAAGPTHPAPARAHVEAEPAPPALAWSGPSASAHALPAAHQFAPAAAVKLRPLPVHPAARPAACVPQDGEAAACVALGAKNAALRERIGQLEQRVERLQATLGVGPGKPAGRNASAPGPRAGAGVLAPGPQGGAGTPAPGPQGGAGTPATGPQGGAAPAAPGLAASDARAQQSRPAPRPPGPMPISAIKPLLPHPARHSPSDAGPPWRMIGGGLAVLAALGGAAALVRARRTRPRNVDIPDAPGMLPRLRERFFSRNGIEARDDPVAGQVAEPTLD